MPIGTNYFQGLSAAPDALPVTQPIMGLNVGTPNERPAWAGSTGIYKPGLGGGLQHLDDAVKAPHMSGAFLRAGANLLSGGSLADAVNAGGGYVEHQERTDAQQRQAAAEAALKQAGLNIDAFRAQHQAAVDESNAGVNVARATEEGRSHQATEDIQRQQLGLDRYRTDAGNAVTMRGQDISAANNTADNATSEANNKRTVAASIYGTDAQYPAGIGSKAQKPIGTITTKPTKGTPDGWFSSGTPATPGSTTQVFPLPANATAATLTPGAVYATARGNARWNGSGFDPL